jgi:hypothetical protein
VNLEISNWLKLPYKRNQSRMKKIRRDEPVGIILHIYRKISQGKSLYSYHYLKEAKMLYFSLYPFSFFFYKMREQDS